MGVNVLENVENAANERVSESSSLSSVTLSRSRVAVDTATDAGLLSTSPHLRVSGRRSFRMHIVSSEVISACTTAGGIAASQIVI